MRILLQRVTHASVRVNDAIVGQIGRGLVTLVGVTQSDDTTDAESLAQKIANLRIFEDAEGKINLSALDVGAHILVVSQFTLYADTRRGRRPDFLAAARLEQAEPLIELFARKLEALGLTVASGQFQAKMVVEIHNDGPLTIWLDSSDKG